MKNVITTIVVWTVIIGGIYLFSTNETIQNWMEESSREWVEENEKKCSNGDGEACHHLAGAVLDGDSGLKKDTARAIELYTKACNLGATDACLDHGHLYYRNHDYTKAISFYEKGCEGHNGEGCFYVGIMYHQGDLVKKDLTKARTFFKKACENDYDDGCIAIEKMNDM